MTTGTAIWIGYIAGAITFGWVLPWLGKKLHRVGASARWNCGRCKECTEWDAEEQECSHWYGFRENDYCSHWQERKMP